MVKLLLTLSRIANILYQTSDLVTKNYSISKNFYFNHIFSNGKLLINNCQFYCTQFCSKNKGFVSKNKYKNNNHWNFSEIM